MIYHFISGSPYTKKFINFMIENKDTFDLNNQFFIINDFGKFKWDEAALKEIKYEKYNTKWGFLSYLNQISQSDKLIIHGLFNPRLLVFLYMKRNLIKRCIWSIWGGDVYFFKYKENNIKHNLIEKLRKAVIPEIPVITSLVKGDYEVVRKEYGTNAKYIYSFYPNPVDFSLIVNIPKDIERNATNTIMIGNSGDPSNNHQKVFEMLRKFKDENIKIVCPLSYGDQEYIEETICQGKTIFGVKFQPLTEFIPPNEYMKILSDVDIAIMNHERQQGLGNIITLLAIKKKVFIRSDTSSFSFFLNNGVKIFDTLKLNDLTLEQLMHLEDTIAEQNSKVVIDIFSNKNASENWSVVFYEL